MIAAMVGLEDARHAMGGACMGDDPRTSVVDREMRVHGVGNLSVASAAVFPDGSAQLPTLTMMALALRLAERLRGAVGGGVGLVGRLGVVSSFTRKEKLLLAVVPPVVALLIRAVGATLRYRDVNAPGVPVGHTLPGPVVFAFWHCSMLTCAHRFRNLGIAILISRSFDGELIARTVERLGFLAVRGSSSRGGAAGLKAMADAYAAGHRCAFTADGPRGPARVAKAGPVQLAELTGATWIGAYHAEPSRAWYLKSWDRFAIPKPFATVTFGWPEHVGPELELVQKALDEAVAMASSCADGESVVWAYVTRWLCLGICLGTRHAVLPDGPTTRGAATSLRAEAFGWALLLVASYIWLPTDGRPTRRNKKACERPHHA